MRWFEYKQEVDAIHAPDSLKAKLAAMENAEPVSSTASAADSKPKAEAPKKRAVTIPWKRILALAACFAFGVIACDAFGWSVLPRMGSGYSISAAATESVDNYVSDPAAGAMESGAMASGTSVALADTADKNTAEASAEAPLETGTDSVTLQGSTDRKIIYNASLSIESKTYDSTLSALNTAVSSANGYIESSDESNYGSRRYCYITCRIPADNYNDFLTSAAAAGSLVSKSQSANDITASYVDVEARISALESQRDRLFELQQQADNLTDLLQIEDSLTFVQYQLESYEAQKQSYDDQIDYCTVTIDLSEVETFTPVETNFWQKLGAAFSNALYSFGRTLANLVFWLAGIWPWLLILAVVIIVSVIIRRKRKEGKK